MDATKYEKTLLVGHASKKFQILEGGKKKQMFYISEQDNINRQKKKPWGFISQGIPPSSA